MKVKLTKAERDTLAAIQAEAAELSQRVVDFCEWLEAAKNKSNAAQHGFWAGVAARAGAAHEFGGPVSYDGQAGEVSFGGSDDDDRRHPDSVPQVRPDEHRSGPDGE